MAMAEESVLLAEPKPAPTAPVAIVSAEAIFRSRLEAGLEGGYRLASVILGDRSEAEDATHDAAERAWRSRSSLRDIERFDAWFQRIIVNACRDRMRSRRSTTMLVSVDGAGGAPRTALADPTSDPFSSSLERDALLQALRLLTLTSASS
jgi:DNA-directed RNA polymerase specialized sigma24 family protein